MQVGEKTFSRREGGRSFWRGEEAAVFTVGMRLRRMLKFFMLTDSREAKVRWKQGRYEIINRVVKSVVGCLDLRDCRRMNFT